MNTENFKFMRALIKAEISYNIFFLAGLGIFFLGYGIITIFNIQLYSGTLLDVDFWGALFSFFFYLLIYSMWIVRLKEKRVRLHSLLPVPQKINAAARMGFILSIILVSFVCITLQLYLVPSWTEESMGILAQLGFVFTLFALFIIGRDLWFLNSLKILSNTLAIALAVAVLLSLTALIFIYVRPFLYGISGAFAGRAVFIIWAVITTVLTVFTFVKRKLYLS